MATTVDAVCWREGNVDKEGGVVSRLAPDWRTILLQESSLPALGFVSSDSPSFLSLSS